MLFRSGNVGLLGVIKKDIRAGALRTLVLGDGGRRLTHKRYKGSIRCTQKKGLLSCVIGSRSDGQEWRLLSSFIGRLSGKYADRVQGVNIEFPEIGRKKR